MKRMLKVNPSDAVPIWKQIEEGVRRLVASGALIRGAPVPSVRTLAKYLRVNPATVAKAYQRLAGAGILKVKRGEGTFVEDEPPTLGSEERSNILRNGATRYASLSITMGVDRKEALEVFNSSWRKLSGKGEKAPRCFMRVN